MPTHTASEPDLRSALVNARQDRNWWSTPSARVILDHARSSLTPLALSAGADPAEAVSYAFETWLAVPAETISDAEADLWAYTRAAVRRHLDREQEAARKLTAITSLRHASVRALEGFTTIDSIEAGFDPFDDAGAPAVTIPTNVRSALALTALEQVLVMAGFTADTRAILVDVFADLVETSPSIRASLDRATAARELIGAPIDAMQWKSLVEVILGTPAGLPGVIELAGAGHPAPAMEPHISSRLMSLLVVAA